MMTAYLVRISMLYCYKDDGGWMNRWMNEWMVGWMIGCVVTRYLDKSLYTLKQKRKTFFLLQRKSNSILNDCILTHFIFNIPVEIFIKTRLKKCNCLKD